MKPRESRHLSPSTVTAPTWLPARGNQDSVKYQRFGLGSQEAAGSNVHIASILFFHRKPSSWCPARNVTHCPSIRPGNGEEILLHVCLPAHGAGKWTQGQTSGWSFSAGSGLWMEKWKKEIIIDVIRIQY